MSSVTELTDFVQRIHAPHDDPLQRAFEDPQSAGLRPIHVGPLEGRTIAFLVGLIGARRVVEIGTLAGYSAIHIARELPDDGRLWTLELDPVAAACARSNFTAAGVKDRVTLVEGDAHRTLEGLLVHGPFDAVFIDADKCGYPTYADWAARALRTGGLLLADNGYQCGNLMADTVNARAMREFHTSLAAFFDTACVPTPDGLVLGRRR